MSVFSLCLFADCPTQKQIPALDILLGEVAAALRDPGTQWMVLVCAGMYFLGFVVLRGHLAGGDRASECGGLRVEG